MFRYIILPTKKEKKGVYLMLDQYFFQYKNLSLSLFWKKYV